mmetsp:Transcript_52788/g.152205  ORF Transcript_52788/g.152205 Transcript_52788/m.152205 type:complete len:213 (-) Transcript_52788:207-845(-)
MPLGNQKKNKSSRIATISEDSSLDGDLPVSIKSAMKVVSFNNHVSSMPSRPSKPKKNVHWNKKVEKKRHYRIQDLMPEEREAVWYNESDSKIILAMAKVTVKMMMKGEPCDDVDYCSRGLEGKTPTGSKQRQKNKLRVRKAVLEEQEIQREEGVLDDDYLGEVSRVNSKDIVQKAHEVALMDEQDIQDYLESVSLDCIGDVQPLQPRRMQRS